MKSKPWGSSSAPPKDSIPASSPLKSWEKKTIDAVGSVIDFWGFKENHGRIWALLYLKETPMHSAKIQQILGLSKGAVSMLMQDLEQWSIVLVNKDRKPRTYTANENIIQMITRVFQQREAGLLKKTTATLQEAYQEAQDQQATPGALKRIRSMLELSTFMQQLVHTIASFSPLNLQTLIQRFSIKT